MNTLKQGPKSTEIMRFRNWLREEVWPLWIAEGVDWKQRAFHEHLDDQRRCAAQFRRLRVAARQVYSFSEAALLGVSGATDAVDLGVNFLIASRQPDGGHPWRYDLQGRPIDETRDLYDHAFVILAFASAARIFDRDLLATEARRTAAFVKAALGYPACGFAESEPASLPRRQNPHMHLLEAAIAAFGAFQEISWFELAQELVDLFLSKFLCPQTGGIAEYYDERLQPLYSDGLFVIEPGHHYEWAWLLMKYRQLLRRSCRPMDHRLEPAIATILQFANKFGVNSEANLVVDEIYSNGQIRELSFRMWPQTERMKYEATRSPAEDGAAAAGIAAIWQLISGAPSGVWHERLDANRRPIPAPCPASTLYHLTCAASEA